jgi:hypothetical protein
MADSDQCFIGGAGRSYAYDPIIRLKPKTEIPTPETPKHQVPIGTIPEGSQLGVSPAVPTEKKAGALRPVT